MASISSTCLSALQAGLATGPFEQCANVTGLASLTIVTGSIVGPLNDYLTGLCPSAACSQDTLNNASAVITNACSADDTSGLYGAILPIVFDNFGGIKAVACIQQTSNSSYCIPELLKGIEDAAGIQLNSSTIQGLIEGSIGGQMPSIPDSVICTDCGSALLYELLQINQGLNVTQADIDQLRNGAQQACPNYPNFGAALPQGISTTEDDAAAVPARNLD